MDNEKSLVIRFKEGDISSFEQLYKVYSGKLYNFLMKVSYGDRYLSEEITQAVFVKLWEIRSQVDPEKSLSAFLCTMAKNRLFTLYQRKITTSLFQHSERDILLNEENTTDRDIDYHLLEEFVDAIIEQMPPARRQIFIMNHKKGMTNKEIAGQLQLSEHTVASQMAKALSFIRSYIVKYYR